MEYTYAISGNFTFSQVEKGLYIYQYEEETGKLLLKHHQFEKVSVGQQYFDSQRQVLYFVDEKRDVSGSLGGGGTLIAARLNQHDGSLTLLNQKRTLSVQPCYVCLDKTGQFALVVHHGSGNYVTKIKKNASGGYKTIVEFDDAALVLFRIERDGSIGEICDIKFVSCDKELGEIHVSQFHCVTEDPQGKLFIVTDIGLGNLYAYGIDPFKEELVLRSSIRTAQSHAPRYGVFHPTLPYFFCNDEEDTLIYAFHYQPDGSMEQICVLSIQEAASGAIQAADITIHPNGKFLYVSYRDINQIILCNIAEDGMLSIKQRIHCGGQNPRGLALSPDAKFLFVSNKDSKELVSFKINEQGELSPTNLHISQPFPADLIFCTTSGSKSLISPPI